MVTSLTPDLVPTQLDSGAVWPKVAALSSSSHHLNWNDNYRNKIVRIIFIKINVWSPGRQHRKCLKQQQRHSGDLFCWSFWFWQHNLKKKTGQVKYFTLWWNYETYNAKMTSKCKKNISTKLPTEIYLDLSKANFEDDQVKWERPAEC